LYAVFGYGVVHGVCCVQAHDVCPKSISTDAFNFVAGWGAGWCVLQAPVGPPGKLGSGSYTGGPKMPAQKFTVFFETADFIEI
jgi:hypothetical protein